MKVNHQLLYFNCKYLTKNDCNKNSFEIWGIGVLAERCGSKVKYYSYFIKLNLERTKLFL